MASSDVIELGSSEDEAEPVPKKKKPTLNAMVHFPNEMPGLVINSAKPALPNLQKVLAGGAITITNVKKNKVTPLVNKAKPNGRSVQKSVQKSPLKMPTVKYVSVKNPIQLRNNLSVNPLSLIKSQHNTRIQGSKVTLPPGITVKRTAAGQKILPNVTTTRKKPILRTKPPERVITTVDLDDDEVPLISGTSPQWYLRPEEQTEEPKESEEKEECNDKNNDMQKSMELENNQEPDTRNYIEITIEDSPIKPMQIRKGFEVGTELPITIEDSPIKPIKSLKAQANTPDSDTEEQNIIEPQSKKRLDYPKGEENSINIALHNVVEIDLEIAPNADEGKVKQVENENDDVIDASKKDLDVQKLESPRRVQTVLITKEVKDEEKSNKQNTDKSPLQKNDSGEFHSTYQKFIDLCFELENSEDMVKIVEKKIKTYYRKCPKDYVESEEFIDMVSSKIFAMKTAPSKMYLYIKDIVDELNLQRKVAKPVEVSNKENETDTGKYFIAEESEYDSKRRRQIRKLERTIKKLHRAIQKLEEQEVEFEDEEDSVYLLTERYKERLIRVHAKFCQLTNTKMPSEPRIQIESRPGLSTGPAKRLEKWVNKKVPIGTPLPFPDFHDVLRCVREANDEDRLGWNEAEMMEEARDLFTRCGKKLQRRRQENEWRIAASRLSSHDVSTLDPAEKSNDLKNKLEENKTIAAKKETELLNKYADKQNQLKLVGEEIGDKEAEESPVESENDDSNDESNSLKDKQKRKDRLKRLLHEKTRRISSEKENISGVEAKVNNKENEIVETIEKMECDAVLDETENKKVDTEEVINEVEIISSDTTTKVPEEGPSYDQKQPKSNESDLYDIDSDIDELHLLQKLYSENEINSSTQESDSDTPIAISDTLDSGSDCDNGNAEKQKSEDIISIENSSYSESEMTKDEYENSKVSEVAKDKKIDKLLLQNAEILLPLSTSRNKSEDDENILLASSEDENNVETLLDTDKIKVSTVTCDTKISNDDNIIIDCEVMGNNCDENSVENETDKDVLNKLHETNKKVKSHNFKVDNLDNSQDQNDVSKIISDQSNVQFESDIKVGESKNSQVSIEKNKDNLEAVRAKSNEVIISQDVFCDESNYIAEKVVFEYKENSNYEMDKYKGKDNCDYNNLINDSTFIDKGELKVTAGKEKNSERFQDDCVTRELCQRSDAIGENEEITSNSIKTVCSEQDLIVNEQIDINAKTKCEETRRDVKNVEVSNSVQCK